MGNQNSRPERNRGDRSKKKKWQPTGLYDSCRWDEKTVRRLINRGKMAPSSNGKDERETGNEHHCPICLLHYNEINKLKCCNATICTECYLQIQEPIDQLTPCPCCKCSKMVLAPVKQLNVSEAAKREKDEQRVIEATIQARKNSESMSIQLPQDPSVDTSSEMSHSRSTTTGTMGSSTAYTPERTRAPSVREMLEPRYLFTSTDYSPRSSSIDHFLTLRDFNNHIDVVDDDNVSLFRHDESVPRQSYDFGSTTTPPSHEESQIGLSEEVQLALAIRLSLTDV